MIFLFNLLKQSVQVVVLVGMVQFQMDREVEGTMKSKLSRKLRLEFAPDRRARRNWKKRPTSVLATLSSESGVAHVLQVEGGLCSTADTTTVARRFQCCLGISVFLVLNLTEEMKTQM